MGGPAADRRQHRLRPAHLPPTIGLLDDSYDKPTLIPGPSFEADEVQLVARATALLDELDAVRIRIFPDPVHGRTAASRPEKVGSARSDDQAAQPDGR